MFDPIQLRTTMTRIAMRWLRAGLLIFETVSRVVRRVGPVEFEPMEKHPRRGMPDTPPVTADPAAPYHAGDGGGNTEPSEPEDPDDGSGPDPAPDGPGEPVPA
jgi:hypothetical protein